MKRRNEIVEKLKKKQKTENEHVNELFESKIQKSHENIQYGIELDCFMEKEVENVKFFEYIYEKYSKNDPKSPVSLKIITF